MSLEAESFLDDAAAAEISAAVAALRAGEPVGMPTETVYGLAVDALRAEAVSRAYELKGRPSDNPLIVHLADAPQLEQVCDHLPDAAMVLAQSFWPGPLTLVIPRGHRVPAEVTGGRATLAVRVPDHPVALALLRAFGGPLAAPSANRSGGISPTTRAHVVEEFASIAPELLVLEGGACRVGLESTVLDLTSSPPRILRPGSVTASALRAHLGSVDDGAILAQDASPGTALRHYAPRLPAVIVDSAVMEAAVQSDAPAAALLARRNVIAAAQHRVIVMPSDPVSYAQRLYAALREADHAPVERILIERLPVSSGSQEDPWRAVRDRLLRATAPDDLDAAS